MKVTTDSALVLGGVPAWQYNSNYWRGDKDQRSKIKDQSLKMRCNLLLYVREYSSADETFYYRATKV